MRLLDRLLASLYDATDERAALDRLRALGVNRAEYLTLLHQAELIGQCGGVDDETLTALLHLAAVRQITPGVERALRRVGIDVRCPDHQHDAPRVGFAARQEEM